MRNAISSAGQTNAFLTVSNFQSASQGNYNAVANANPVARKTLVATLFLNSPLRFGNFGINATSGFTATLLGAANTNYVLQTSTNLANTNWTSIATNNSPFGIISVMDTNVQNFPGRFYRAVPQ